MVNGPRKEGVNLEGWRRVKLAVESHTESPTEKVWDERCLLRFSACLSWC